MEVGDRSAALKTCLAAAEVRLVDRFLVVLGSSTVAGPFVPVVHSAVVG